MTKKDYSGLSADEVTEQYGILLEGQMNLLRDRSKGQLSTLFSVLASRIRVAAEWRYLHDAMLEKNGVKKMEAPVCYNYLPEVIAAVEARGSHAADKIQLFEKFVNETNAAAKQAAPKDLKGPFAGVRERFGLISARVAAAKNWAPA